MDMQQGILSRFPEKSALIAKVAGAIRHAREHHIKMIVVRLGFRHDMPELNPANKPFTRLMSGMSHADLDAFMQLDAGLGVRQTDIIVSKKRYSAFSGSDLGMILRVQDISSLVLTGISTSGIVLSTLGEAFDKDYQLTVLSDACADRDEEVHRFLLEKIFPKQAEVMTVEDWGLGLS